MKSITILRISILLNILFAIYLIFLHFNSPSRKNGILTQDVNVGFFANDSTIFVLPKGLTVRDASPRGFDAVGRFENNRFEIIISTDRSDLVDYEVPKDSLFKHGNLYSADRK